MAFRVILSDTFYSAFDDIAICGHGFYSQKTIKSLMRSIKSSINTLTENPLLFQRELSIVDRCYEYRRIIIKPYFKLLYFVNGENVVVDEIWDTRRDPAALLSRIKN